MFYLDRQRDENQETVNVWHEVVYGDRQVINLSIDGAVIELTISEARALGNALRMIALNEL